MEVHQSQSIPTFLKIICFGVGKLLIADRYLMTERGVAGSPVETDLSVSDLYYEVGVWFRGESRLGSI